MGVEKKATNLNLVVTLLAIIQICSIVCLVYLYVTVHDLQLKLATQEEKTQVSQEEKEPVDNARRFHLPETLPTYKDTDSKVYASSRTKRQANSSLCGGKFFINRSAPNTYRIQSPNYPLNYPHNTRCHWEFIPNFPEPRGYIGSDFFVSATLSVAFTRNISIEAHSRCIFDAIEIKGGSEYGPLLAKHCGVNRAVPSVNFTGPIHIFFKSDRTISRAGFSAEIKVNWPSTGAFGYRNAVPSESRGDATYTRWGKSSCREGSRYYDGYAFGIGKSDVLRCVPFPVDIQFTTANISTSAPQLTAARFVLNNVNGALSSTLNNKPIRCALCHVEKPAVFMMIGWRSCYHPDWTMAYTGYLMTVWSGDRNSPSSAEPICMENSPEESDGYGVEPLAPKVTYVKSGTGLWIEDKLVPCVVCFRSV